MLDGIKNSNVEEKKINIKNNYKLLGITKYKFKVKKKLNKILLKKYFKVFFLLHFLFVSPAIRLDNEKEMILSVNE